LTVFDLLEIAKFFFELDSCDFRVQSYIARDLIAMAGYTECESCSRNAAFQLALCYSFGFGVRADIEKRQQWLLYSGRDLKELEETLNTLKQMKPPISAMSQITELGYESQLANDYESHGTMEQAILEYQAMAASRERVFGRAHFSARRMYVQLADFLRDTGNLEEAARIYIEEIRLLESQYGPKNRSAPLVKSKLARTYAKLGRFEESELTANEVLDSYSDKSKDDIALRVVALYDLSSVVLNRGNYEKAVERALAAVEESQRHLGPSHRNTWRAKGILASAYSKTGEPRKAVQLIEQVVEEKKHALGAENPETIESMNRLGPLFVALNEWEKAKGSFKEVFEALQRSDGKSALSTLRAHSNYAGALARTGEAEVAAVTLEDIISKMAGILNPADINFVGSMANLAIAYQYQGLWEKAEPIQREVLTHFQHQLGESDARTLVALRNLSDTLYNRKKWDDAAKFSSEELRISQCLSSNIDEAMVHALTKAARSNAHLEKWDEAVPQLEQELRWRRQISMIDNIDSLEAIALAAAGYLNLRKCEEARIRVGKFFEMFLRTSQGRKSLLDIICRLAALCENNDLLEEAEELFKLATLIRQNLFPETKEGPQEKVDEEKIVELMRRQGKPTHQIVWDPTSIIERSRKAEAYSN
jgi:tetratricopeptide (TPR) repeat protein